MPDPRPSGRWRPRTHPERVIADIGYSHPRCHRLLRQRNSPRIIPMRRNQRVRRARRPGRPGSSTSRSMRRAMRRNVVEQCINRPTQWRGLATRYEQRAVNYRAMVVITSIAIWLGS